MVMFKRFTIAYAIYICIDRISLRTLVSSSPFIKILSVRVIIITILYTGLDLSVLRLE